MKTMYRIISVVLVGIFIFACGTTKVLGLEPQGSAVSDFSSGAPNYNSGNSSGQYPTRGSLKGSKTAFVGLLVSLIEYDTSGSSPSEQTIAKVFLASGGTGTAKSHFTTMDLSEPTDHNDQYYSPVYDKFASCGHTEPFPSTIVENEWKISYNAPSRSAALQGVTEVSYPDINGNSIAWSIQKTGGINDRFFTSIENVKSLMGITIDSENLQKYFIKYEPVYRTYPGILDSKGGFAFPSKSEGSNSQYSPAYGYPCGHTITIPDEPTYEVLTASKDKEGNCPDGYVYKPGAGKCTMTETIHHYNNSYNCVIDVLYTYQLNTISGLPTSMATAREGYLSYANKLYNSTSGNAQMVVDDKGNLVAGEDDYFIGSSYKTAIAAADSGYHKFNSRYNKYLIVDSSKDTYAPNKTLGMAFYSLASLFRKEKDCTNVCSGDKSSDEYLQCSQSFCDSNITYSTSEYATNLKRDCIIKNCKYVPKNPIDCSPSSSLSPYNDFKNLPSGITDTSDPKTSTCGKVNEDSEVRVTDLNSYKGGYSSCKRVGDDTKVKVNGTSVYAYGVSNTQNTYINVACNELASVDFKDLSKETITPGEGFNYYAKLYGTRECLIFFDTEQWKFDFASTHSLDTVRKTLLLNKVKAFNELVHANDGTIKVTGTNVVTKVLAKKTYFEEKNHSVTTNKRSIKYVVEYAVDNDSIITIDNIEYNTKINKNTVNSSVTEYVNSKPYVDGNKSYSDDDSTTFELTRTNGNGTLLSESKGSLLTKSGEDELILYADYDENEYREIIKTENNYGTRNVNRYTYTGSLMFDYQIPEVCVSEDNRREIGKPTNGICNSTKFGDSSTRRLYYTHPNATPTNSLEGINHSITSEVKVHKTNLDGTKGDVFLNHSDTCKYAIDTDDDNDIPEDPSDDGLISCEIVFDRSATGTDARNKNGQVCYKGDDVFFTDQDYSEVRMVITNKSSNDEDIESYTMVGKNANGNVVLSTTNNSVGFIQVEPLKFTYKNGKKVSNSRVTVVGTIKSKLSDGSSKTYKCAGSIILAKKSSGCTITKNISTNRYEVTGASGDVYIATGNNKNIYGDLVFNKIEPVDGKYFAADLNPKGNEIVIANTGGDKYCLFIPTTCPSLSNCHTECNPNYDESCVTNYCNSKGKTDGYYYYPTCKDACSGDINKHTCEYYITDDRLKEKFDYVSSWCNDYTNLAKTTHKSSKECLTKCYKLTGSSVYRTINLNNPFPASNYSPKTGYETGKREVGKEWKINIDTIEEDKTAISQGKKVEYLIELTPSTIKAINQNTIFLNNSYQDSSIYTTTSNSINQVNKGKLSTCTMNETSRRYTGYCSSFIHKSEFTEIFKVVDGVKFNGEIYE